MEERRVELVAKVASLEERTNNIIHAVERIEKKLDVHGAKEEQAFSALHTLKSEVSMILNEFKDSLHKQIDNSITPLKEDFIKYKGMVAGIAGVVTLIWTAVTFFKEPLINLLK